jgi:hypothetical protein
MSKKNVFTASEKVIGMNKGNLQFNTSTPEFRTKVQLFADGINAMNYKRLYFSDCIKTARHSLELYNKGTYIDGNVVAEKEAEIAKYQTAVREITAEIAEKMPTYDDTDKNLFYAYRTYVLGEEDVPSGNTYKRAMMEWLDNAGIAPTDKGITFIMSQMGVKKASAKTMCKNGGTIFTTNMTEKQYLDIVYRTIATMMYKANALKPFTYDYVIEDKKATKNA